MKKRQSWQEKLMDDKDLPKIVKITPRMSKRWGTGTVVIPAPREVDKIMKKVPYGKLVTINEIRNLLAKKHYANIGCPITTGIFAWIAANAAEETIYTGQKKMNPYWRTLKSEGELNPKYPGGIPNIKKKLESEGHHITQKGKKYFVDNYQDYLAKIRYS